MDKAQLAIIAAIVCRGHGEGAAESAVRTAIKIGEQVDKQYVEPDNTTNTVNTKPTGDKAGKSQL